MLNERLRVSTISLMAAVHPERMPTGPWKEEEEEGKSFPRRH
jgi:hypothetical protein